MRARGPGGQHVNTTASAVRITHRDSGARIVCQQHREQRQNIVRGLQHMRVALACVIRGRADHAWLLPYRRNGKIQAGPNAKEWHLLVAVALDALADANGQLAVAAAALELSSSQLTKLLSAEKQVLQAANTLRQQAGHPPLRPR